MAGPFFSLQEMNRENDTMCSALTLMCETHVTERAH